MAGLCQTGHLQAVENCETRLFSIAISVSNLDVRRRVERITLSGRRPQASENPRLHCRPSSSWRSSRSRLPTPTRRTSCRCSVDQNWKCGAEADCAIYPTGAASESGRGFLRSTARRFLRPSRVSWCRIAETTFCVAASVALMGLEPAAPHRWPLKGLDLTRNTLLWN
jgi:hypothetical protein